MIMMKIIAFALVAIAMALEPAVKKAAAADGPSAAVMYTEGKDLYVPLAPWQARLWSLPHAATFQSMCTGSQVAPHDAKSGQREVAAAFCGRHATPSAPTGLRKWACHTLNRICE